MNLYNSDCLETLKNIPDNSIDSLVTDPPAGIGFMGKHWDDDKGGRDHWIAWMSEVMRESHRVLKPGAHGLVWALPRTSHWTAMALENAGFEVRDVVTHLFGSGFPKSLNISKAIDKAAGAKREVVGHQDYSAPDIRGNSYDQAKVSDRDRLGVPITAAATEDAKKWEGFGTALKPASEHWILVRKSISEKTVAANILKWGVGGLNIDGCRIEGKPRTTHADGNFSSSNERKDTIFNMGDVYKCPEPQGRFPANLVLSHTPWCTDDQCDIECAIKMIDEQSGNLGKSSGGASRFFYCAKISTKERNEGLDIENVKGFEIEGASLNADESDNPNTKGRKENPIDRITQNRKLHNKGNFHPTVKPKKLMSYLIRLVTPPNGTVLDPFMGSGSTGIAAIENGFEFVGIEKEKEYFDIARTRIRYAKNEMNPIRPEDF